MESANSTGVRFIPRPAEYLKGTSPRQRASEKQRRVLSWVREWGFSSAEVIRRVAGQEARGYAKRLARLGLLTSTRTEAGGVVPGVPVSYYTLSPLGLAEAERQAGVPFRYPEIDPYKVSQRLLRHSLLAQRLTLNQLDDGSAVSFMTERHWANLDWAPKYKRPDVVLITPEELRIGVEIELTAKWDRDMDEFVGGVVNELLSSGVHTSTVQAFLVATDSKALAIRYRQALAVGATYRTWRKDHRGHWTPDEEHVVPELVDGLITVALMKD